MSSKARQQGGFVYVPIIGIKPISGRIMHVLSGINGANNYL
jgi:hypothetical protein